MKPCPECGKEEIPSRYAMCIPCASWPRISPAQRGARHNPFYGPCEQCRRIKPNGAECLFCYPNEEEIEYEKNQSKKGWWL